LGDRCQRACRAVISGPAGELTAMTMATWIIVAVVGVALLAILAMSRSRRSDAATMFQRQIDALSPEARRGITEQIKDLSGDDPGGDSEEVDDGP